MENTRIIRISAISLIVLVIVIGGGYAGFKALRSKSAPIQVEQPTDIATSTTVNNIVGLIEKIQGNEMHLLVALPGASERDEPTKRIVDVNNLTKLYTVERKSFDEFTAEIETYKKLVANGDMTAVQPIPLKQRKEITLKNLSIGQRVVVITDVDIVTTSRFTASEISLFLDMQ